MTEIYMYGPRRLDPQVIVWSDFATRVTLDGVAYTVVKWTTDSVTQTRTIDVRPA